MCREEPTREASCGDVHRQKGRHFQGSALHLCPTSIRRPRLFCPESNPFPPPSSVRQSKLEPPLSCRPCSQYLFVKQAVWENDTVLWELALALKTVGAYSQKIALVCRERDDLMGCISLT